MAGPNTDLFSGSGATGVPPDEAINNVARIELLAHWALEARKGNVDFWPEKGFCGNPRSPILMYCNPGKYNPDGYKTIANYTQAVRDAQVNTFLSHRIARSLYKKAWFAITRLFKFRSGPIKREILGAPSKTRGEYIKVVAARYHLEPALLAGVILVEQRDQSEAEDIADAFSLSYKRMKTSIGLGQVRALSVQIYGLLDDVIDIDEMAMLTWDSSWLELLSDEALNINATAKYLRLVANAGAEVQEHGTNSLLEKDPLTCDQHWTSNGRYNNSALLDLTVMGEYSSQWSNQLDSRMPATVPATVVRSSDNIMLSVTQDFWDKARRHYYLRVLASQYTSCPFDPTTLRTGVQRFDKQGSTWVYRVNEDNKFFITNWADFLPIAYEDCKRSGFFS